MQGFHRLTAKLLPDAASVALCVGYLVQVILLFHCLLAYSARYGACKHSPSHMPTQAVTNPLKLVGPRRRPTDCGRVRIRCTICSNTRCTFAFTVVAMVSALVSEHEARLSPPYSQTTARCSQCCTVCGVFGATNPAFPLLAGTLCTLWCLQAANRPTCTALDPVQIARAMCRLKL